MSTIQMPARPPRALPGPTRVVCGIDASSADEAAVREACELAGRRGHVALICVMSPTGPGLPGQAALEPAGAVDALERAMKQARAAGVRSSVYLLRGVRAAAAMLRAGADADMLVVGTHSTSRAAGIALGSVATSAVHRSTVPVLVARPRVDKPPAILFATDGSKPAERAGDYAAAI